MKPTRPAPGAGPFGQPARPEIASSRGVGSGSTGHHADTQGMTPYPLGRKVNHDPRSLHFQVEPTPDRSALKSVKHVSNIPVLDQGNLGSCTGNAATKCLSYAPFWDLTVQQLLGQDPSADESYAVGVYSDAEVIDGVGPYPPNDEGSNGLSVAKVLKNRGLISGYQHATSLDAVLTALQTGPVITGTLWLDEMFTPTPGGQIVVGGKEQGGHEYVLDEVDMENRRIWMQNSWGTVWGINGRAFFTFDDYAELLAQQGDATVFVPASQPAPKPVPPTDAKAAFLAFAPIWAHAVHSAAGNAKMATLTRAYLDSIGA